MPDLCIVDLGFGHVKAKNGENTFFQQSILGTTKPLFEQSIQENDIVYNDEYFVGNLALRHSDVKYFSMKDDKSDVWISEVLLKSAIGQLTMKKESNVISGLPVKFYHDQKDSMAKTILSLNNETEYTIKKGKYGIVHAKPSIANVKIVPQGYGIAMDYLLANDGSLEKKDIAKKKILVADLGFYTLNLLSLDKLQIATESDTFTTGVHTAYKLLQQYIREKFGKTVAIYELDPHVLTGEYNGYDIAPLITKAFKALAMQVQSEIESLNRNYDLILVGGGAAKFVFEHLTFSNKELLDQFAQMRGYGKIGVKQWKTG